MAKALIRLKSIPVKPKRKKGIKKTLGLVGGDSLAYFIDKVGDTPLDKVTIEVCGGWEQSYLYLTWKQDESDEEFEGRMERYLAEKAKYDEWYCENQDLADKEMARRKKLEEEKKAKAQAARKKALIKRTKDLEKEKKKLDKEIAAIAAKADVL